MANAPRPINPKMKPALHCTALHCTALRCTALHCTALHCTALHRTAMFGLVNFRFPACSSQPKKVKMSAHLLQSCLFCRGKHLASASELIECLSVLDRHCRRLVTLSIRSDLSGCAIFTGTSHKNFEAYQHVLLIFGPGAITSELVRCPFALVALLMLETEATCTNLCLGTPRRGQLAKFEAMLFHPLATVCFQQ